MARGVKQGLDGANIIAAVGVIATATDLTLAGGAGTALGAALSGHSLLKSLEPEEKALAKRVALAFGDALENNHLTDDRRKIAAHLLVTHSPTEDDLTTGSMQAGTIAGVVSKRVAELQENQNAGVAGDPAYQTPQALQDFTDVLKALLTPALRPANTTELMLQELLARSDQSGRADALREEGITEKAIIRLAQRISAETEDVGQAWLDLQNAMDIAVRVQSEGLAGSNHGDFVDAVLTPGGGVGEGRRICARGR
jgi:plasmid maintenance system antidote protein VapI